ncbi:hypothetical protein E4U22_008251 [Claviceps purpurea]|nr:hypothetical protein E4U22_008251 [Claviceps purpurea]
MRRPDRSEAKVCPPRRGYHARKSARKTHAATHAAAEAQSEHGLRSRQLPNPAEWQICKPARTI